MSYTINPNAKNKWARNAENTMDLSLETDASSVYLDNGRTLEQEIGEGSMVSNVTTVDTSMSKVIDGTLDGAYESGVMYGRSLVNLVDGHSSLTDDTNVYTSFSNGIYTYSAKEGYTGNIDPAYILTLNMVYKLSVGKTYTVLLTKLDSGDCRFGIATRREDFSGVVVYSEPSSSTDCVRKFKFTPSTDDYTYVQLRLVSCASSVKSIKFKDIMIIEGDYTYKDIPYFTGLCDVKMPILRNLSSECSTLSDMENGTITGSNGTNASNTEPRSRTKGKKKLNGASSILFSDNLLGVQKYLFSYDSNGSYLGRTPSNWGTENEIPVVEGAHYYRVAFAEHFENLPRSMHIVPKDHKTNILHTPETVILRSLPNGVRDELNLKTGEYIKRIGEVVLDGSDDEGWGIDDITSEKHLYVDTHILGTPQTNPLTSDYRISDKFNSITHEEYLAGKEGIRYCSIPAICISKSKLSVANLDGFKQYLQQNPVTVQYQLETPITTTIESLSIPFAYENGHIVLESGYKGQSLLPTLEYSTVINRTGQIQSIANTVQKQEKQITKLEQMLIQNIINLDYNNTLLTLKNEMEEML